MFAYMPTSELQAGGRGMRRISCNSYLAEQLSRQQGASYVLLLRGVIRERPDKTGSDLRK
jgi:hypothetical protein